MCLPERFVITAPSPVRPAAMTVSRSEFGIDASANGGLIVSLFDNSTELAVTVSACCELLLCALVLTESAAAMTTSARWLLSLCVERAFAVERLVAPLSRSLDDSDVRRHVRLALELSRLRDVLR